MPDRLKRIYVSDTNFMSMIEIALIDRANNGRFVGHYDPVKKILQWEPIDQGGVSGPGPTLRLDVEDAVELYTELHKFFSARGMKNRQESYIEGELAGTKKHLEDLRHILKMPKEPARA